jgi:hypothetical protein
MPKMKPMKLFGLLLIFIILFATDCFARAVRVVDMKALIAESELVFAGKVKSVKPSGITTELTYPTWNGVVFEWLKVEVEVIEPIKGTKKGDVVWTLMLSTRGAGPSFNSPGMVNPKKGQQHLLCLLPTELKGFYASVTAPFDDNQAIFILDRTYWLYSSFKKDPTSFDKFPEYAERYKAIWSLVDDNGQIVPKGAEGLRNKYKVEIATEPTKSAVIHLKWKKETSQGGWQWNVPDEVTEGEDIRKQRNEPVGPITLPQ